MAKSGVLTTPVSSKEAKLPCSALFHQAIRRKHIWHLCIDRFFGYCSEVGHCALERFRTYWGQLGSMPTFGGFHHLRLMKMKHHLREEILRLGRTQRSLAPEVAEKWHREFKAFVPKPTKQSKAPKEERSTPSADVTPVKKAPPKSRRKPAASTPTDDSKPKPKRATPKESYCCDPCYC
ncbi:hypothetical protein Ae201684_015554 [Aphanomyces euteiches]|uniref:Uncharacterized protein n=1 Tax=Aphanomyces euteiches TaxID=100861 RepID=A0A6G0WFH6_9STRA|nr:hypothetical protein Ae201684_015554 [Aphanomyces euteiches]